MLTGSMLTETMLTGTMLTGQSVLCRFAITGAEDCTARVWDLQAPSQLPDQNHAGKVHCMAVSPDGTTALSVGADAAGMVWNVRDGSCRHTLKGHAVGVHWGCISSDGRHMLTAAGDRMVKLWDCHTGACLATLPSESAGHVQPVLAIMQGWTRA